MRNSLPCLLLLSAWCASAQQPTTASAVTVQEWRRVHRHPKSPDDYRVCAQWARQQAEIHHQKQTALEAELKALHARPANHEGPKYPPTEDQLRGKIEYCRGQSLHWTQLAADYERKALAR